MHELDPYAPPSAAVGTEISDFEIVGNLMQTRSPLALPHDLCVKCGARDEAGKTFTKKLFWTPSWVFLTMLISWIITLILHIAMRKQLDASFHLCPDCNSLRKKKIAGSAATSVATIVLFFAGVSADAPVLLAIGGLGFIAALAALIIFAQPVIRPKSHNHGVFTVTGASPPFLAAVHQELLPTEDEWLGDAGTDGAVW